MLAVGGLVGALVLLVTSASFAAAAIVVSLANAFLIPLLALAAIHYYEDVAATALPGSGSDGPVGHPVGRRTDDRRAPTEAGTP